MPLTNYLATEPKIVPVRESSWAAIVDEEDTKKSILVDMSTVPTAPRGTDIDLSSIPTEPPFVARVENLSFEADEEQLRRIFADLNPNATRVLRDGTRSKGVGLVELPGREQLIEAIKRTDKELFGRKIRVLVSKFTDVNRNEHQRNSFGSRSNRTGEERAEMADQWKRVGGNSDRTFKDRPQRNDFRKSNNSRNDYGFGYSRTKDNRQKDNEERNTPAAEESNEPVKERPRLQLQPRTKPIENVPSDSPSSADQTSPNVDNLDGSSHNEADAESGVELTANTSARGAGASIFGGAKPVDTTARELEIEKKIRDLQVTNEEQEEEKVETTKPEENREVYRPKRSNYNNNQSGRGNDHSQKQDYNSTRRYENDNRKSQYNNSSQRRYDNNNNGQGGRTNRGNYHNRSAHNNQRRTSDDDFTTESQSKNSSRNNPRKPIQQTEDNSNKLQLSNKFGMLDDDDNEDETSPVED